MLFTITNVTTEGRFLRVEATLDAEDGAIVTRRFTIDDPDEYIRQCLADEFTLRAEADRFNTAMKHKAAVLLGSTGVV